VRKSAAWLVTLLALCTVLLAFLALLALAAYLAITYVPAHSTPGWLLPVAIALQGALWLIVLCEIAWGFRRRRTRSPAERTRLIHSVLPPLGVTIALADAFGQRYGRSHGTVASALAWTGCVPLVIIAADTAMREYQLLPALKAWAGNRSRPSG
jgi:membrane protein implicated in regulation of membrane protease activity